MLVIGVLFDLLLLLCDFCSRRSYILMILMTIPSIIIGNAFARMVCIICGFLFWILLLCLKGLFLSECSILVRIIDYWSVTCSSICNTFFVPLLLLFLPLSLPLSIFSLSFFNLANICRILKGGGTKSQILDRPEIATMAVTASRHRELLLQTNRIELSQFWSCPGVLIENLPHAT